MPAEGIGVIPWSPLARGRLTRDWDETSARSETDEFGKTLYAKTGEADRKVVERVAEIAGGAGFRGRRLRSLGCCTSRSSPRQSSVPRSRSISRMRWLHFP